MTTIKQMRVAVGMTQAAFAEKLQIPVRTLQNWETGRRACPEYLTALIEFKLRAEGLIK